MRAPSFFQGRAPRARAGARRRVAVVALAAVLAGAAGTAAVAQMPRGRGQIRGEVSGPEGDPLIGISIVLAPTSRADVVYATSTDDKGRYALNGLVADRYRIRADGQGFVTEMKEGVRVQPPFRAIIDFEMAPAPPGLAAEEPATAEETGWMESIRGLFVNAEGEPVLEGSVVLQRRGSAGDIFYARTDPDGRFSFSHLPAGQYDVTTRSPGLIPLHLVNRTLPAGDVLHVRLIAPRYPLSFKGWLDDLLPPESAVPPPSPRLVELGPHGVAPAREVSESLEESGEEGGGEPAGAVETATDAGATVTDAEAVADPSAGTTGEAETVGADATATDAGAVANPPVQGDDTTKADAQGDEATGTDSNGENATGTNAEGTGADAERDDAARAEGTGGDDGGEDASDGKSSAPDPPPDRSP